MGIGRWTGKAGRFWDLSLADKWLFLRAVAWLAVARIWLARMPFSDLAGRLSAKVGREEPDPELLRRVAYAVAAAAGNVPWRSDCFPKAIAANKLLQRSGYASTIHLGVDKEEEDQLIAHAWLTCGEIVVTGGEDLDRYTEMLAL
jgi:hypothetical protein